jgi:hypothetical protein
MRALCGAIITAGAMIGLGLLALGVGTRYTNYYHYRTAPAEGQKDTETVGRAIDFENSQVKIHDLDNPMKVCLVSLLGTGLIGLAITFLGLAYHHYRRYHEHLRGLHGHATSPPGSPHNITV